MTYIGITNIQIANPEWHFHTLFLGSRLYSWKPVLGDKLLGISIGREAFWGSKGVKEPCPSDNIFATKSYHVCFCRIILIARVSY